jgi:hypothetical protein
MNCPKVDCEGRLRQLEFTLFSDESGANVEASCTSCVSNFVVQISEGDFVDLNDL